VTPGPRAFDIKPIEYDLTPFAGLLNDGRPHRIDVSVVGVPQGQTGWRINKSAGGGFEFNGTVAGGYRLNVTNQGVYVYYPNGVPAVELGVLL